MAESIACTCLWRKKKVEGRSGVSTAYARRRVRAYGAIGLRLDKKFVSRSEARCVAEIARESLVRKCTYYGCLSGGASLHLGFDIPLTFRLPVGWWGAADELARLGLQFMVDQTASKLLTTHRSI